MRSWGGLISREHLYNAIGQLKMIFLSCISLNNKTFTSPRLANSIVNSLWSGSTSPASTSWFGTWRISLGGAFSSMGAGTFSCGGVRFWWDWISMAWRWDWEWIAPLVGKMVGWVVVMVLRDCGSEGGGSNVHAFLGLGWYWDLKLEVAGFGLSTFGLHSCSWQDASPSILVVLDTGDFVWLAQFLGHWSSCWRILHGLWEIEVGGFV